MGRNFFLRTLTATFMIGGVLILAACNLNGGTSTDLSDEDVADIAAASVADSTGGDTATVEQSCTADAAGTGSSATVSINTEYSNYQWTRTVGTSGDNLTLTVTSSSNGSVDRPRLSGDFQRSSQFTVAKSTTTLAVNSTVTVNGNAQYSGQHEFTSLSGAGSLAVTTDTTQTWNNVTMTVTDVTNGVITLMPTAGSVTVSGAMERQRSGFIGTRESAWNGTFTITFASNGTATATFSGGRTVTINMTTGQA